MSKLPKSIPTLTENYSLIELKAAVACYHSGEYNQASKAKDACYTSHNSMMYKSGRAMEVKAEMAALREQVDGEIVSVNLAKKFDIYQGMMDELAELQETHEADLAVYKQLTGEVWKPHKKSAKQSQAVLDNIDKILAS